MLGIWNFSSGCRYNIPLSLQYFPQPLIPFLAGTQLRPALEDDHVGILFVKLNGGDLGKVDDVTPVDLKELPLGQMLHEIFHGPLL